MRSTPEVKYRHPTGERSMKLDVSRGETTDLVTVVSKDDEGDLVMPNPRVRLYTKPAALALRKLLFNQADTFIVLGETDGNDVPLYVAPDYADAVAAAGRVTQTTIKAREPGSKPLGVAILNVTTGDKATLRLFADEPVKVEYKFPYGPCFEGDDGTRYVTVDRANGSFSVIDKDGDFHLYNTGPFSREGLIAIHKAITQYLSES